MKKYTFATLENGKPGQCWEVPAVVYDWIYNKGYRDGKEEGELTAYLQALREKQEALPS